MNLFEEATGLDKAGRYDEAEKLYDMLLSQNHDNAGLLATMGVLYLRKQKYGLAISLFHRALLKDPKHSEVLSNLGLAYKNSGQIEKCHEYLALACEGNPTAEVLSNYAGIFTQTGNPGKAQELCERALAKNPDIAIAHWNLSLALLESGQWERAWEEHEWGLKKVANTTSMRVDREIGKVPYWDGTPGKTVAVYGEQGLGDEIMFASMLQDLMKTNTVILECHKRLKHLFELNFPGVPIYGTREDHAISWPFDHEIDYRVSIGSLGKFYRKTKESFPGTPYLKAEPAPRGKKFRVGISWTGGQKASRVQVRTVPLSWWKAILCNDCEFISLQYTDCAEEISATEKQGYSVKQFPEIKSDDYYETAKLVASCDLVISVCTSVIHLAGALGVPCWVMVPDKPAWRYGAKGPIPWYSSVRLYRQNRNDSWIPVVEKIAFDLRDLLEDLEEVDGPALIRAA